jgi:hypothetical protein
MLSYQVSFKTILEMRDTRRGEDMNRNRKGKRNRRKKWWKKLKQVKETESANLQNTKKKTTTIKHPFEELNLINQLHILTWQFLRVGVADSILPFNGGYELVDERVCRRLAAGPDFRLEMLNQLLIRRIELHTGR